MMGSYNYLYTVFSILMLIIVLLTIWAAPSGKPRLTISILFGIILGMGFYVFNSIFGKPKHVHFADFQKGVLLGSHIKKNEAIWLFVLERPDKQPIYYQLPYSEQTEEKLKKGEIEKEEQGSQVLIIERNPTNDNLDNLEFIFYPPPPPRDPPKHEY